ncbi:MAG: hypothetical protein ACYDGR_07215 [Candidatus Dormibacteria bacterium]
MSVDRGSLAEESPLERVIRRATEQMLSWCDAHAGDFPSPGALDAALESAVPTDELSLCRLTRERHGLHAPVEEAISHLAAIRVNVLDLVEREVLEAVSARHIAMRDRRSVRGDGPERGM